MGLFERIKQALADKKLSDEYKAYKIAYLALLLFKEHKGTVSKSARSDRNLLAHEGPLQMQNSELFLETFRQHCSSEESFILWLSKEFSEGDDKSVVTTHSAFSDTPACFFYRMMQLNYVMAHESTDPCVHAYAMVMLYESLPEALHGMQLVDSLRRARNDLVHLNNIEELPECVAAQAAVVNSFLQESCQFILKLENQKIIVDVGVYNQIDEHLRKIEDTIESNTALSEQYQECRSRYLPTLLLDVSATDTLLTDVRELLGMCLQEQKKHDADVHLLKCQQMIDLEDFSKENLSRCKEYPVALQQEALVLETTCFEDPRPPPKLAVASGQSMPWQEVWLFMSQEALTTKLADSESYVLKLNKEDRKARLSLILNRMKSAKSPEEAIQLANNFRCCMTYSKANKSLIELLVGVGYSSLEKESPHVTESLVQLLGHEWYQVLFDVMVSPLIESAKTNLTKARWLVLHLIRGLVFFDDVNKLKFVYDCINKLDVMTPLQLAHFMAQEMAKTHQLEASDLITHSPKLFEAMFSIPESPLSIFVQETLEDTLMRFEPLMSLTLRLAAENQLSALSMDHLISRSLENIEERITSNSLPPKFVPMSVVKIEHKQYKIPSVMIGLLMLAAPDSPYESRCLSLLSLTKTLLFHQMNVAKKSPTSFMQLMYEPHFNFNLVDKVLTWACGQTTRSNHPPGNKKVNLYQIMQGLAQVAPQKPLELVQSTAQAWNDLTHRASRPEMIKFIGMMFLSVEYITRSHDMLFKSLEKINQEDQLPCACLLALNIKYQHDLYDRANREFQESIRIDDVLRMYPFPTTLHLGMKEYCCGAPQNLLDLINSFSEQRDQTMGVSAIDERSCEDLFHKHMTDYVRKKKISGGMQVEFDRSKFYRAEQVLSKKIGFEAIMESMQREYAAMSVLSSPGFFTSGEQKLPPRKSVTRKKKR